jgi:hypothetical protein
MLPQAIQELMQLAFNVVRATVQVLENGGGRGVGGKAETKEEKKAFNLPASI